MKKILCMLLACALLLTGALSEEETAELFELTETETETAASPSQPGTAADPVLTVTDTGDGAALLSLEFAPEALLVWQRVDAQTYAALSAEERESRWETLTDTGRSLTVSADGSFYRAVCETEDGLYVSNEAQTPAPEEMPMETVTEVLSGVTLSREGAVTAAPNGEAFTLSAAAVPETLEDVSFSWKTSSSKIAAITADGASCAVQPGKEGTATVTVTAKKDGKTKSASVKITVIDPGKPISISIDPSGTTDLNLNETLALTALVEPDTYAGSAPVWKSSSAKVASVDEYGNVTALKEGTAAITASVSYGGVTKKTTVKIRCVDPLKPQSVTLSPSGTCVLDMGADETLDLSCEVLPESARESAQITWKSGSPKVASVDENGHVTPLKTGTAKITVTAAYGSVKKTASMTVKVTDSRVPTGVTLSPSGTVYLAPYETLSLTPALIPETAAADFSFTSSKPKYAEVDENGTVTALKEGTAKITVTAVRGSVKKTASVTVKVVDPDKLAAVTLDASGTQTLTQGFALQLGANVWPDTAEDAELTWTSSASKYAVVNENGLVTGIAPGTATIKVTAKQGSVKKTASVKVKVVKDPYAVSGISLSETGPVEIYENAAMKTIGVSVRPAGAQVDSWTVDVSDESVFTVSTNLGAGSIIMIKPVKEGTATLTVTAVRGVNEYTASVDVIVKDPYAIDSVSVERSEVTLYTGEDTRSFDVTLSPDAAQADALTAVSSDSETVSAEITDGALYLTGLTVGTADITVTASRRTASKTCSIHVTVKDGSVPDTLTLSCGKSAFLEPEDTLDIQAVLAPAGLSAEYTWESSNPSVLTVTADGSAATLTGLTVGYAAVTATAVVGEVSLTASAYVTVGAQPVYRALIIGNTYAGNTSGVSTLPPCAYDSETMSAMIKGLTGIEYEVTALTDRTAAQMKSDILSAFADADENDISLFYYSGHGTKSGSLVGNDISFISPTALRSVLDEIPGRKIVILDSCYSGAVIGKSALLLDSAEDEDPCDAFNDAFLSAFTDAGSKAKSLVGSDYYVITASSKDEQSWTSSKNGKSFGRFTYYLEKGCGWDTCTNAAAAEMYGDSDGDGLMTFSEVYTYAADNVNTGYSEGSDTWQSVRCSPDSSSLSMFSK